MYWIIKKRLIAVLRELELNQSEVFDGFATPEHVLPFFELLKEKVSILNDV